MLTEKEKDELYEEFKRRMETESITKRRNVLSEVRDRHIKRWMAFRYGEAGENLRPDPVGYTGWNKITGLISKTLYVRDVWHVDEHPGMDKLAVEMAQELSDLYFKYAEKNWLFADRKGENDDADGTDLAQDSEHGFEET